MERERQLDLFGATALGVGAIVGGGIMALAGVASSAAGPAPGTPVSRPPRAADAHAPHISVGARGSEVSLGRFLQDQLVHRQWGDTRNGSSYSLISWV